MKKWILSTLFFLLFPVYLWAQGSPQPVYDQATDIQTNTSHFSKNLSAADTDVQKALNTLDQMSGGSSQWSTSGSNIYYKTGNVGIGTSAPRTNLDILGNTFVSGNLGVGSTAPRQKLDIGGGVIASTLYSTNGLLYSGTSAVGFGDSIMVGYYASDPPTNSFIPLIATETGWTITNHGTSSYYTSDAAPLIYAETPTINSMYIYWLGTNDKDVYTNDNQVPIFKYAHLDEVAYLALPDGTNKFNGQSSNITYAGNHWANTTGIFGTGKHSSTQNDTATFSVYGKNVLIGTIVNNSTTGTFSVTVDGVSQGSYSDAATGTVTTTLGQTNAPRLIVIPNLSDTMHTVIITVTSSGQEVYLSWVGGSGHNGDTRYGPKVYVGNLHRCNGYGTDARTITYNNAIENNVSFLASMGLQVVLVDVGSTLTFNDLADGLHPTTGGHAKVAQAFEKAINGVVYPMTRQTAQTPIPNIKWNPSRVGFWIDDSTQNNSWTERVALTATGLGIGTTASRQSLDVIGNANVSGNVGIGSTAPQGKLDVNGTIYGDGTNLTGVLHSYSETDPKVGTLTTNYLPKWSSTTLANSNIFDTGTAVGIGTSAPTGSLQINGTSSATPLLLFHDASGSEVLRIHSNHNTNLMMGVGNAVPAGVGAGNGIGDLVIGYQAGNALTSGYENTLIGYQAGYKMNTGYYNTAIGEQALYNVAGGNTDFGVGYKAGLNITSGSANSAIGNYALQTTSTTDQSTAVGDYALSSSTGERNSCVGAYCGYTVGAGTANTGVGDAAFYYGTGNYNVFMGTFADYGVNGASGGSDNTMIGYKAGYTATAANATGSGSDNVFIGYESGQSSTVQVSNSIAIGSTALVATSNTAVLGNDSITTTILKGNIGIGTTTPANKLQIIGSVGVGTTVFSVAAPTNGMIIEGNVGIGTSSPSQTLTVTGNVKANQFIGDGSLLTGISSGSSQWTTVGSNINYSTGNVGIGTSNPIYKLDVNGSLGIGTTTTTRTLYVNTTNSRVGIGTTVPSTILSLEGATPQSLSINSTASGDATISQPLIVNGESSLGDLNGNERRLAQSFTLTQATLITGASIRTDVSTGSPSGNVTWRIETISSGKPSGSLADSNLAYTSSGLTSNATTTITFATPATLAAGTYALVFGCDNQPTNNRWLLFGQTGGSAYTGGTDFYNNNGGAWTDLGEDLTFSIITGTAVDSDISFQKNSTILWDIGLDTDNGFKIGTTALSTGTIFTATTTGIGIGTTAPDSTLEVSGTLKSRTATGIDIFYTNSVGNIGVGNTAPGNKLDVTGNADFSGNVGIGTATPTATLTIAGTVTVSNVNSIGWSVISAANQACNTTCYYGCVVGFDQGTLGAVLPSIVSCADATADQCLCAGAN